MPQSAAAGSVASEAYPGDTDGGDQTSEAGIPLRTAQGGVAVAQALQVTEEPGGYPAPPTAEQVAEPTAAYPAGETLPTLQPVAPEPVDSDDPFVIGEGDQDTEESVTADVYSEPAQEQASTGQSSSRLLLWMAFIIALIIFTASVAGAVVLYNRRRIQP